MSQGEAKPPVGLWSDCDDCSEAGMGSPMAEDGVSNVGLAASKGKQHIHSHGNLDVDLSHGNVDGTLQFWRDMSGDEGR